VKKAKKMMKSFTMQSSKREDLPSSIKKVCPTATNLFSSSTNADYSFNKLLKEV
jgi:hypothetical protein